MKWKVFYRSTNGKNYFERVTASSAKAAEKIVREKYNDIAEIVQVSDSMD